ncbi:GNAT family N-acetyltransferase [Sorangium sp. So ce119]|uniref:GNAT family N-acetyltransferase n=1 Tax=Sorangium sp. So ce119 TaxID=3133279 RepID=UPI003F63F234
MRFSPTSIEIRRAEGADVAEVHALMRAYYAEDEYPFSPDRALAALSALVTDRSLGGVWVLVAGGEVAGYCAVGFGFSLEFHGRDAFVDELYVRPEARGRGHAARLLDRAEQGCREAGVRALHLEVEPDKAETYAWYRRRGFADHERRMMTKWLAPGPGKEDP